jgi:hypothetical protein
VIIDSVNAQDDVNYVDEHGIIKFVNWVVLGEKLDLTLLIDREPFIGRSIHSVLTLVNTQDIKDLDQLLCDMIFNIYARTQPIVLPYPLPFGEAHCLCCRWNDSFSSSRAVLPSCVTYISTYLTTGDRPAASDWRYLLLDEHPTEPVRSKVFTIRSGQQSIWCGLRVDSDSRVLQYMQFLNPPSTHTDYVQCEPVLVIISVCKY